MERKNKLAKRLILTGNPDPVTGIGGFVYPGMGERKAIVEAGVGVFIFITEDVAVGVIVVSVVGWEPLILFAVNGPARGLL